MQRFAAVAKTFHNNRVYDIPSFWKLARAYIFTLPSLSLFLLFFFLFCHLLMAHSKYHTYHRLTVNRSQSLGELANDIIELGNPIN